MPKPDSAVKTIFTLGWEDFKEKHPGKVPRWMYKTVLKMLRCRTEKLGCHFLRCEDSTCGTPHFRLIPHSCKQRICASCGKVGNDNWLAKIQEITLPIIHHHITFTVPFELRPLIQTNLVVLLNALYETSAKAVMKYAEKRKHGFKPGILSCCQTYGSALNFNPHIHMAVTTGGVSLEDGKSWVACEYFDAVAVSKIFVAMFVKKLRSLFKKGELTIPRSLKEAGVADFSSFSKFLGSLVAGIFQKKSKKSWSVFVSQRDKKDPSPVSYIGRYIRTPPISEKRIEHVGRDGVCFSVNDYALKEDDFWEAPVFDDWGHKRILRTPKPRGQRPKRQKLLTLTVEEMIDRLIQHILPPRFKIPRFYGLYANRNAAVRKQVLEILPKAVRLSKKIMKKWEKKAMSWRERRTEQNGEDPVSCKGCGSEMKFWKAVSGGHGIFKKYSFTQIEKMGYWELVEKIQEIEADDTS